MKQFVLNAISRVGGLYALRMSVVGLGFASTLLAALLLGPDQFGAFALMWAISQMSSALVSVGAPAFLLRELPARAARGHAAAPLWPSVRLAVLWPAALSIALAACSWLLSDLAPRSPLAAEQIALAIAAGFAQNFLSCVSVPVRLSHGATLSMALRDGVAPATLLLAVAAGALTGAVSATFVVGLATGLTLAIGCAAAVLLLATGAIALSRQAPNFAAGAKAFWANAILGAATANLDVLLAGAFLPRQTIGAYAILKRLANFVSLPQIISNWTISVPAAAAHVRMDRIQLEQIAGRGVALAFPLALGVSLALALSTPIWASYFHLSMTTGTLTAFALLVLGNLGSVAFGATFTLASQCGLEAWSFAARLGSTIIVAVGVWVLAMSNLLALASLAGLSMASTLFMNGAVWATLRFRLGLDCSVARLLHVARSPAHVGEPP